MLYVLRVSLPDRPGSLHALTGACAGAGADIVSLDVIERGGGVALDDLCLTVDDVEVLRSDIDALPGTMVASVRPVASARDVDGAIALAARMVTHGRGAVRLLVDGVAEALWASWAVAVANGWSGMEVLAASDGAIAPAGGGWLPLTTPRRLHPADILDESSDRPDLEIAAAPLGQPSSAVIVARRGGPRFVERELRQLQLLADVAVATEVAHTPRRPIERVAPPRSRALRQ